MIDRYGPAEVVRIEERPVPEVGRDEVLVRVEASAVGVSDAVGRSGSPWFARLFFGLRRPKYPRLGTEFAGTVERVGDGVSRFAPGDRVFGAAEVGAGATAEYVVVGEHGAVARAPGGLDAAHTVATVDGFLTALPFLRDVGAVEPGQSVLVNGASGTVGSAAVQLAKHLGASVTAVTSGPNAELVRSLGADRVIDRTREDFTTERDAYDVIFDAVGKRSFGACRRALTVHGIYLTTVPTAAIMLWAAWTRLSRGGRRAAIAFTGLRDSRTKGVELEQLAELVASGAFTPVVDRILPLDDLVAAHRRVESGHKVGSVVIAVTDAAGPAPAAAEVDERAANGASA
jgi:NADPH:quinone reductase-like Zn-dependent oxidoreductase